MVRPTHLHERWRERHDGVSPFGICLRPAQPLMPDIPFAGWAYRPPYLPESLTIHVADNAPVLTEPMLFYLAFAQRPDSVQPRQPIEHQAGLEEITKLRVISPRREIASPAVAALEQLGIATFVEGEAYCLEIEFDGNTEGKEMDFRPQLPLKFLW